MSLNLTLSREDIVRLCERVEGAQRRAYAIPKLTDEYPAMTIDDGYAVQHELRRRYLAKGARLVGEIEQVHDKGAFFAQDMQVNLFVEAVKLAACVKAFELAVTPQTAQRFEERLGAHGVAVLHSHLSDGERFDEWTRINDGRVKIVVGARSALSS